MLFTENPSIKVSANKIIKAFTISKNNPKVTMVIGRVKIIRTGFTNTFKTAKTMATIMALIYMSPDKVTPGRKWAKVNTAKAVNKSFRTVFMIFSF